RDAAHKAKKFHFANYLMTAMRLVLTWGVDREWLAANPAAGLAKIERPKELGEFPNRVWSEAEKDIVMAAAKGGMRIAIGLGRYAAMREGDALSVKWEIVGADGRLRWIQQKTKQEAVWPIDEDLAALLEEARLLVPGGIPAPSRTIVVNNRKGRPYTQSG